MLVWGDEGQILSPVLHCKTRFLSPTPLNPCWTQEDGNFLDKDFVINPCSWYTKDKYFASLIEILLGLTYLDSVWVISCLKQWQLLSQVLLCIQVCVWKLILSKGVLRILFVNRVGTVQSHINSEVSQIGTWSVCYLWCGKSSSCSVAQKERKPPMDVLQNLSIWSSK